MLLCLLHLEIRNQVVLSHDRDLMLVMNGSHRGVLAVYCKSNTAEPAPVPVPVLTRSR